LPESLSISPSLSLYSHSLSLSFSLLHTHSPSRMDWISTSSWASTWPVGDTTHITRVVARCKRSCDESWHTYEWVMAHAWMSHGTRMNESWHTHEWVMSHTTHITRVVAQCERSCGETCRTHEWVMAHQEWVMAHTQISHINESCLTPRI